VVELCGDQLLPDHHPADDQAYDDEHNRKLDQCETVIFPVLLAHALPDFPRYYSKPAQLRYSFPFRDILSADSP
jgi:hypothetical protein